MVHPTPPSANDLADLRRIARSYGEALGAGRLEDACAVMTEDCVARLVAVMLFNAFYVADGMRDRSTLEGLIERHGLPRNTRGDVPRGPDAPRALAALLDWLVEHSGTDPDPRTTLAAQSRDMEFSEFRMYGSGKAYADTRTPVRSGRLEFKRTAEGWRIEQAQ